MLALNCFPQHTWVGAGVDQMSLVSYRDAAVNRQPNGFRAKKKKKTTLERVNLTPIKKNKNKCWHPDL